MKVLTTHLTKSHGRPSILGLTEWKGVDLSGPPLLVFIN